MKVKNAYFYDHFTPPDPTLQSKLDLGGQSTMTTVAKMKLWQKILVYIAAVWNTISYDLKNLGVIFDSQDWNSRHQNEKSGCKIRLTTTNF